MYNTPKETAAPRLSVVIPAYNEEGRIGESLEKLADYLAGTDYAYEALITDDGSRDGTLDICRAFADEHPWLRIVHYDTNRGKGYATRTGMLEACGDYVLLCDADLATPIEELDGFWQHINDGFDVVIASRAVRDSELVRRQPLYRELAGRAFNLVVRTMAVRGIHDTQCGFKLFSREAAHSVFPLCTLDGFSFDIEVLHIAQRLGYRIREAGVHWHHCPGSKVSVARDGMKMLRDLLEIRLRHRNLRRSAPDETR